MKNKIGAIIYFISLTFLSGFNFTYPETLSTGIRTQQQLSNPEIINLFKQKLPISKDIIITSVPRGVIVSINSNIFFEQDKTEIKDCSKNILLTIGDIIKSINKLCIIEGHDKNSISENTNSDWEFSVNRAENIVNFLIENNNINSKTIRAIGFGQIMPFSETVSFGKNMSRRIDFVILNYPEFDHILH
ncbi:OmpA family protein [bacterium]|nr:OmpA family protein [bacterium]